jgi:hypothetical protein
MNRILKFAGFAGIFSLAQTIYAIPMNPGPFSVTGGVRVNVQPAILSKSNPFGIPTATTVAPKTTETTGNTPALAVTPRGTVAATVNAGNNRPTATPTMRFGPTSSSLLSALHPILPSLSGVQGIGLVSRYGYQPATIDNRPGGTHATVPTPTTPQTPSNTVPDGGATVGLLGLGLVSTAWVKKKLSK